MGSLCHIHVGTGKGRSIFKWKRKRKPQDVMSNDDVPIHEGVKTIGVDNYCDLSAGAPDLCICIVTWNMHGQVSYEDIKKLVGTDRKFHLLVVGLQEAPRSNISRLLKAALVESHILLGKSTMQSLHLYMYGPKNSELFINELKKDKYEVRGCDGLRRRKKGAVGIRINFKGIRMEFISCHLSPHTSNVEERNTQFKNISNSLFSKNWNPHARPAQITIWLGDLNYRLQGIKAFPARSLINENLQQLLTSKDQLLQEAKRGQIFDGYYEGTLAFKPTYKYDIGSTSYDTSHKVRVPSWTDRILFKIEDLEAIDACLHSYESIDTINSSDHRPVKAHLCLKINKQSKTISN